MLWPLYLLSLSLTLPLTTLCTSLTISLRASNPNGNNGISTPAFIPSTHATLTSGSSSSSPLQARLTRHSTLTFPDLSTLPPGSYLLDIYSRDTVFAPLRVDLETQGKIAGIWETYRGSPWEDKGGSFLGEQRNTQEEVVIEAKVLARRNFYEERPGFSPLSLLKSPMILLGVVALAAMVGMPYLMDNMDPEMRAEFEEQQKSSPLAGVTKAMQGGGGGGGASGFDLASWMAGAPQQQGSSSASSGADVRGGGGEGGGRGARKRG
ncbi:MAG: hypothetical protein Q9160_005191 [Pyrenula sp. 1 TL-2023]